MEKYAVEQDKELIKNASRKQMNSIPMTKEFYEELKSFCLCGGEIDRKGNTMICSKGGTSCFESR